MRYTEVFREIGVRGLAERFRIEHPRRAREEELLWAHDAEYVRAFLGGTLDKQQIRRIGFRPWTEHFVARTLEITGATIQATARVLAGERVAGNLAGGTHHAFYDRGEGYCVFNDIAVAAHLALREGVRRIAVVDLDVHQGNGTAALFQGEARVATFSMHGARNYPFRKEQSDCDVEFADETGDEEYLAKLGTYLPPFLERTRPELVFYQAGVDALSEDRLGRLCMTREGLKRRNAMVFDGVDALGVPVVILMGGGYSEPIAHSVAAHVDVYEEAQKRWGSL